MTMDSLLDRLADELAPVRPVRVAQAYLALGLGLAGGLASVALGLGIRADFLSGTPNAVALLRSGILLVLGATAAHAVVRSALPGAGVPGRAWLAGLAIALTYPLAGLLNLLNDPQATMQAVWVPASFRECLTAGFLSALVLGGLMVAWLRRAAPTRLRLAGLLAGLSAGAFGAFAYSIRCPYNDFAYIGLWYGAIIGGSALAGRAIIPPLVRW